MKLNNKTGKNLKYSLITREKEGNTQQIISIYNEFHGDIFIFVIRVLIGIVLI